MQEPGRRPAPPFAGVDLRRPRGYPAPAAAAKAEGPQPASSPTTALAPAQAGDPCPRCESRDTKFCYYNNYNTSQPRHFCKSCRRYWTKGGSLRNVPVGGGTRKGSSSSSSSASSSSPKSSKRSKSSKRRRVAPAPDASTTSTADDANTAPSPAPPTVATATVAAAEKLTAPEPAATVAATEKPAAAEPTATVAATEKPTAPPATGGGFTDMSPAPRVGLADVGSGGWKELLPDPSHFEWPSGCDLGPYWGTSVFVDNDPALFLNLP